MTAISGELKDLLYVSVYEASFLTAGLHEYIKIHVWCVCVYTHKNTQIYLTLSLLSLSIFIYIFYTYIVHIHIHHRCTSVVALADFITAVEPQVIFQPRQSKQLSFLYPPLSLSSLSPLPLSPPLPLFSPSPSLLLSPHTLSFYLFCRRSESRTTFDVRIILR